MRITPTPETLAQGQRNAGESWGFPGSGREEVDGRRGGRGVAGHRVSTEKVRKGRGKGQGVSGGQTKGKSGKGKDGGHGKLRDPSGTSKCELPAVRY